MEVAGDDAIRPREINEKWKKRGKIEKKKKRKKKACRCIAGAMNSGTGRRRRCGYGKWINEARCSMEAHDIRPR
jgi:hypothetical protein